jgi:tRNA modification GTPase
MRRTIFAPATPPGRGAVAIIRLSGPSAGVATAALCDKIPPARRATFRNLRDPADGSALDQALILWFPGPDSVTGEDVAEFHLHGGVAVSASVLDVLAGMADLRPAEPGEFTRRAFENGRMDLTEAEAIADLVDAETRGQQAQALRQMQGELARIYEDWRGRLVRSLAHLEADLDFPDEDLPEGVAAVIRPEIMALAAEIAAHLDDDRRGERVRAGFQVAILGAPNVGKSSLLNALARRDAAIVSERAGTTRDVVEAHMSLGGMPVVLMDTAGLRESGDEIEEEGIRRARQRAAEADFRLLVFDASSEPDADVLAMAGSDGLVVANKIDLASEPTEAMTLGDVPALTISVKTGQGLDGLEKRLMQVVTSRLTGAAAPALTRARHRTALEDCRDGLLRAGAASEPELVAEDVRLAVRSLGRITGRVDVEDLLDVIFRDFCIGK